MIGDVLGDDNENDPAKPLPTGTFRENDNVKDDIGWGDIPSRGPKSRGSMANDDEFDVVDNILDDIE